ncbi:MAG TPA: dioxygenase [Baekduia sp.]|nr:dioxygenase [Baekduia sp.]
MTDATTHTTPDDITAKAVGSFADCADPRLRQIMESFVGHLHGFIKDVGLTQEEWVRAVRILTATGHITDDQRQEWILWSDALGVSMLVDALEHQLPPGVTESTVLGPFYVPGSPLRPYGDHLDEAPAGDHTWYHGRVLSEDGTPLADAEIDVWQNGDNELYAVQDPDAPEMHLRGRFRTRADGSYGFVGVRPTPYPIPADGPVGSMLAATGRHPWRPAHIHVVVRAEGHRSVTTHLFDGSSRYIDSDTVFAVKPSLLREFVWHEPHSGDHPAGVEGGHWSLESDIVLARGASIEPIDAGRTA